MGETSWVLGFSIPVPSPGLDITHGLLPVPSEGDVGWSRSDPFLPPPLPPPQMKRSRAARRRQWRRQARRKSRSLVSCPSPAPMGRTGTARAPRTGGPCAAPAAAPSPAAASRISSAWTPKPTRAPCGWAPRMAGTSLGWESLHGKDASPGGASSFALLLQHPRVPVLRQHPEQEEQHEDATRCCRHVHPVSGEGGFSALGGPEQGSAAGCQRWFVPTGTWITRFLCHWPTGSSLCTSGKQVRLDLGHQKCSPKVVAS